MQVKDFDYKLPHDLIAQEPLTNRSQSRLLVVDRESGQISHSKFTSIIDHLNTDDVLVLNDSRVRSCRLHGIKSDTGAQVEVLLLRPLSSGRWEALIKPYKRIKAGTTIIFGGGALTAQAQEEMNIPGGRILALSGTCDLDFSIEKLGEMPLPPYIKQQVIDKERYQTVYAKEMGSAAAPTAGLHFTHDLLTQLTQKGIKIAYITLHVGIGTFRPVTVLEVEEHNMHPEFYEMSTASAEMILKAKRNGNKVIAVGTTSVRTLETIAQQNAGHFAAGQGWTDIFIYPGFKFQVVDHILTNFHLPKSTLLMLISAFSSNEQIMTAYKEAVRKQYRFFSFGDAMLIL